MSSISFVTAMLIAGTAPSGHVDHLMEGRVVVQDMLDAVAKQDQLAFGRLVKDDALFVFGDKASPARLQLLPAELGCANPKVVKVEPSENVANDSRVTVTWSCKPRLPEFDGNLAVKFWVHGGQVVFGERV